MFLRMQAAQELAQGHTTDRNGSGGGGDKGAPKAGGKDEARFGKFLSTWSK